ncbi:MAG: exodeoxyribonuclease I [Methylomonas sp.]|jgi:exodeoxyribonuclease-1|uniref:exodeoxyribonuclease I n=1 Tax=Methylomonas sp. TaxID=418 RepID=UPI0025D6CC22|nr:exodeoxyribonuclease I [Methylomonas sp.]MCK9607226.1 exodeoxyribonuclease I [Methylomonas sp.]
MTENTYYWHDYETFGTDPQRDRACQFAGIRTDQDFNLIGEPLMLYCKTATDYLPNPEACLITGITPQLATEKGVCEAEFIGIIHDQLSQAGTCGIGYNSIRFDDEVTRNLLYRNFYDPYAREWQNGNSRWDLIDVARAARALRPDGINWPVNDDGIASFRLEVLTQANGIAHQAAHDALSDVYATIALARLIRQKQPKLYDYLYNNRHKPAVLNLLQLGSFTPLAHVSGRFPARKNCLSIVVPLYAHPRNSNEIIVYDLSVDPRPLLELSAEQIQQRVFVANDDLPEHVERIPLKTVHINKSPVLAPLTVIRQDDAQRLELDLDQCRLNLQRIKSAAGKLLEQKLATVFTREYADTPNDPDLMIYSGGFFSHKDKNAMQKIRQTPPEKLANFRADFDDARLPEMLFRYRGRNYPHTLNQDESPRWQQFCCDRLFNPESSCNLAWFNDYLQSLQGKPETDKQLLMQLQDFAASKQLPV